MNLEENYIPWLFGLAAILVLLWLTWRRPNRRRLPWRMAASIIAGASLFLLIFPPTFDRLLNPATAILLTEGYEPDTLNALLQRFESAPLTYSYQNDIRNVKPVANLYTLLQNQPQLQTIHVVGNGLEDRELKALKGVEVIPHLAALPVGIYNIHWPASTTLGNAVEVAGQYNVPEGESAKLYLLAAGKVQDSIVYKEAGLQPFQLNFMPKQEGKFVYQVLAKTQDLTDTLGQVPVHVTPAEQLGILLLSSAPLFEFKFLKNHLGELQHRVALRSTVSKGITQSEWINMPKINLGRITPKLLEQFDLVITEPQALQDLNQSERTILQRAVTDSGLGVLTIHGEQQPKRATAFFTGFRTKRITQQPTRAVNMLWPGSGQASATALPYSLVNDDVLKGLVQDKGENLLAAAKKEGWGTVAISMIPQTFSWQLEGKEKIYASYWAHLLSEIAKKEEQEKFWQMKSPRVPKEGQPLNLVYTDYTISNSDKTPAALVRSATDTSATRLTFQQHQHLPEQFAATFWPQHTGWHVIETTGAPDFHFFVQDTLDWQNETLQLKRAATMQFAARQDVRASEVKLAVTKEQISAFWFFLLFIVSSGFLWLEEKL